VVVTSNAFTYCERFQRDKDEAETQWKYAHMQAPNSAHYFGRSKMVYELFITNHVNETNDVVMI